MRVVAKLLLLAAVAGGAWAATAWPRLNDVETGQTPEYPDLQPRDYRASQAQVVGHVREIIATLPGWVVLGSGSGPAGAELHAVRSTPLLRFKDDVYVHVQRKDGRTHVSVRSKSRLGAWDFGQNARNIRELLGALDERLP